MSRYQYPKPNSPELVMPVSMFQAVAPYRDIVFILTPQNSAPLSNFYKIVKIAAVPDNLYPQMLAEDKYSNFLTHIYYDITQIRECAVKSVRPQEWYRNIGEGSLNEWINAHRKGPNTLVKIFHLRRVNYDLTEFNKEYKWRMK